jgi:uncharacterized protein YjiS (DUF1127 family)
MDDADPTVPAHLRPVLGEAAELEFEFATDGFWPEDEDERSAKRERALQAAQTLLRWRSDACGREELVELADIAVRELEESAAGGGPRAAVIRELTRYRDALAQPTEEAPLDEPA